MFDNSSEKSKHEQYQCTSEFGLYRYEEGEECYSGQKRRKFSFGYFIVSLTCVIVLSSICLVVYNYLSEHIIKLQPISNDTSTSETKHNQLLNVEFNTINVTYSREVTTEHFHNNTEISENDSKEIEDSSPQALEFRRKSGKANRRHANAPRPFLYENRDPRPTGFQSANVQQTAQTQNKVKNIQEIIQLLSNQNDDQVSETTAKRIKTKNRKHKVQSKATYNNPSFVSDPFFPYKPQNPSDINLLAPNSFRFAPTVQMEKKRPPATTTETYPKYERPYQQFHHRHQPQLTSKDSLIQNQPISVTLPLDLTNKRAKMRKPSNLNLYNQNQYFNQPIRFQQNLQQTRPQQYFRPWNWNLIPVRNSNNQIPNPNNQYQQGVAQGVQSPMIVHLNLYPKKKKKNQQNDEATDETNIHSLHNCTTTTDDQLSYFDNGYNDNVPQIKNTTEFNQLLEQVSSSHNIAHLDQTSNDKGTITDNQNLFRIKNTFFELDKPDPQDDVFEDFRIQDNDYLSNKKPNVEIQKSIGFTLLNTNFNNSDFIPASENNWRPITIDGKYFLNTGEINVSNERDDKITTSGNGSSDKDENYGLEVGEVDESFEEKDGVTLPVPSDIFEKYFNPKPTPKYNTDWDPAIIKRNPNLINHRATFQDRNE